MRANTNHRTLPKNMRIIVSFHLAFFLYYYCCFSQQPQLPTPYPPTFRFFLHSIFCLLQTFNKPGCDTVRQFVQLLMYMVIDAESSLTWANLLELPSTRPPHSVNLINLEEPQCKLFIIVFKESLLIDLFSVGSFRIGTRGPVCRATVALSAK